MTTTTLQISAYIDDFVTNAGGFTLYTVLKSAVESNDLVFLSFKGISATSSSFLNSSLGALVDEYGLAILKKIRPTEVSAVQASILKKYIQSLRKVA